MTKDRKLTESEQEKIDKSVKVIEAGLGISNIVTSLGTIGRLRRVIDHFASGCPARLLLALEMLKVETTPANMNKAEDIYFKLTPY